MFVAMKDHMFGGARYFVTFIDDFSRKVEVYTLMTKRFRVCKNQRT